MNSSPNSSVQLDPIDSPYPIPWNWIWANQIETSTKATPYLCHYRTQALVSPDGRLAAYSRLRMQVEEDFTQSQVSSVLFVENLQTGNLQTIVATSPLADNPFISDPLDQKGGTISIVIPVAWSEGGDRLLAREFESIFGSDIASDYAVLWQQDSPQSFTVAPTGVTFSHSILLGWSQMYPDRALFRTGILGESHWPCWSVDTTGRTEPAPEDQPLAFGQLTNNIWMGPQAS